MNRLTSIALTVLALVVGSELVGVTVLFLTGRLSPAKLNTMAAVMRGEQPVGAATSQESPSQDEEASASAGSAATQPTDTAVVAELRERELERRASELAYQRQQLQLQMKDLVSRVSAFRQEKSAWEASRKKAQERMASAGRAKAISLLVTMRPKSAKEMVIRMPPDEAASILGSIDERKAGRILKEFKSGAELERARDIFERLRKGAGTTGEPAAGEAKDKAVASGRRG